MKIDQIFVGATKNIGVEFRGTQGLTLGFSSGASGKELTCQCRFDPWVEKISWGRAWQPTPVFLLRESHGQRSLVGSHSIAKSQT